MKVTIDEFHLDQLHPMFNISAGKAGMMMEACVWCMSYHKHHNGVLLEVEYKNNKGNYRVFWPENSINIEKLNNNYNHDDAVEFGAEAIAIFVSYSQIGFRSLQRSKTKTGIDYWISFTEDEDGLPFQNAGRLEISGIMKENGNNTVKNRIKIKNNQTMQSANTLLPAYIVVVLFEKPSAQMVVNNEYN